MGRLIFIRKIFFLFPALLLAFSFLSCSKDSSEEGGGGDTKPVIKVDIPGKIAGLGKTAGQLTGTEFKLPNGISLVETIKGFDGAYSKSFVAKGSGSAIDFDLLLSKASTDQYNAIVGSGGNVCLWVNLRNATNKDIALTFPEGLIVKARSADYQNGVLLKRVKLAIPANSNYKAVLLMYCGNLTKKISSSLAQYDLAVVSNSSLIVDLTKRFKGKKINYEEFTAANIKTYTAQMQIQQDILWFLTDYGYPIDADDLAWISKLPAGSD